MGLFSLFSFIYHFWLFLAWSLLKHLIFHAELHLAGFTFIFILMLHCSLQEKSNSLRPICKKIGLFLNFMALKSKYWDMTQTRSSLAQKWTIFLGLQAKNNQNWHTKEKRVNTPKRVEKTARLRKHKLDPLFQWCLTHAFGFCLRTIRATFGWSQLAWQFTAKTILGWETQKNLKLSKPISWYIRCFFYYFWP